MSAVKQNMKIKAYIITDNFRLWQLVVTVNFFVKNWLNISISIVTQYYRKL